MNITWEKRSYSLDYWVLHLVAEFNNKKVYSGDIIYKSKGCGGYPYCIFNFSSLGINGKKIDYTKGEEAMKKEALMFLKQKMETKANEYNLFCNEINNLYS